MKTSQEILKEIEELGSYPKYPERKMGEKSREQFLKELDIYLIDCDNFMKRKIELIHELLQSILNGKEESQYIDYIFCNRKTHFLPINFLPFNLNDVSDRNGNIDFEASIERCEANISYYCTFMSMGAEFLRRTIEQKRFLKEEQKKSLDKEHEK